MKNVKMFMVLNFSILVCLTLQGQDLIRTDLPQISSDTGITSGGSTALSHLIKIGIKPNGDEFSCGFGFTSEYNLIFTIAQQADLIYFETYYDSIKTQINTQGYYRLIFIDTEIGYCWKKDLIWNTFNQNGNLIKKQYYNSGVLSETPKMPQPNVR